MTSQDDAHWPFAMPPHEVVGLAYRACLGREPDPQGLSYWTGRLVATQDPTVVLQGVITSAEYLARQPAQFDPKYIADEALSHLGRSPTIVDVGAQAYDVHAYSALSAYCAVDLVGFDPLEDRIVQRAADESMPGMTLLPYALGDGKAHVLHVNNEDATSSLFPLNSAFNAAFNHLSSLQTVETKPVQTTTLDQSIDLKSVDFLKLDVQGAELMVLENGRKTLDRTAVVHCEVEFSPIYDGQPLFPAIADFLQKSGFYFVDFVTLKRYHYVDHMPGTKSEDHLLWADAVFFREANDAEALAAQALIAATIYQKPSLAKHLLERAKAAKAAVV